MSATRRRRKAALQYQLPMSNTVEGFEVKDGMLYTGLERYFAGGCNTESDVRGCLSAGSNLGICLADLTAGGEAALLEWLQEQMDLWGDAVHEESQRIFIDTGAFAETSFPNGRPVVTAPITMSEWAERYARVHALAPWGHARLHVVTPDRVADQLYTLELLRHLRPWLLGFWLHGVRLVVPVQKGPDFTMATFREACLEVLGLEEGVIWGIPGKKDATSLEDLRAFAGALPEASAVHFLGMGPHSPHYPAALRVMRELRPDAEVWSDSVRLRALVGQGRPLTEATRAAEMEGHEAPRQVAVQRVLMGDHSERIAQARAAGWRDEGDEDWMGWVE